MRKSVLFALIFIAVCAIADDAAESLQESGAIVVDESAPARVVRSPEADPHRGYGGGHYGGGYYGRGHGYGHGHRGGGWGRR